MAPRKCKAESASEKKTRVVTAAGELAVNYQFEVDPSDKEAMQALEAKVRARRAQIGDEAVDGQVGDIVPDLGCTRNRDTKFHCMMELYRHVKAMVAQEGSHRSRNFGIFSSDWRLWNTSLVC